MLTRLVALVIENLWMVIMSILTNTWFYQISRNNQQLHVLLWKLNINLLLIPLVSFCGCSSIYLVNWIFFLSSPPTLLCDNLGVTYLSFNLVLHIYVQSMWNWIFILFGKGLQQGIACQHYDKIIVYYPIFVFLIKSHCQSSATLTSRGMLRQQCLQLCIHTFQ